MFCIMSAAISNCPILCETAPMTLMPMMLTLGLNSLYIEYMTTKLRSPPARLYINPETEPPTSIVIIVFRTTMESTSLKEKKYKAVKVIMLASPSFAPGMPKLTGMELSITCKTRAWATSRAMKTSFLVLFIKFHPLPFSLKFDKAVSLLFQEFLVLYECVNEYLYMLCHVDFQFLGTLGKPLAVYFCRKGFGLEFLFDRLGFEPSEHLRPHQRDCHYEA